MFNHFFSFELRYWLRSFMVWLFLGIIALMIFGAVSSDQIQVGSALQNTNRNAPFVIENYYSFICLIGLLMSTAFVNSAASRDFASNTHQMMFSTPLRKAPYLLGRFLGSALAAVIPLLGVSIGILLAKYMPWVDPDRWGRIYWRAHLDGILVFAIPNTLFIAAVIFTIAVLTRSTVVSFIGSLLLLTGYGVADALTTDLKHETIAALIDPFGIRTFTLATKYWTVAEKNHACIGFTGLLLWNRLIWIGAAVLIFVFAYWRFSFSERARSAKKQKTEFHAREIPAALSTPRLSFGWSTHVRQFLHNIRFELKVLVKSVVFIVIAIAALLNSLPNIIFNATEGFGDVSLPVTYLILSLIAGSLYLFLVAMITYYAGVLVWEERDTSTDEIHDALPHPEWPQYAAKLIALLCSLAILQFLAMLAGICVQLAHGYSRIQLGLYVTQLFGVDFSGFVFLAVLAFFIHVVSPNKYVGYFVYIVFALVNLFVWTPLHVGSLLVQFSFRPRMRYSDFFGFKPYLESWTWFTLYWGAFCGVLAVASIVLWQRGRETRWKSRLQNAGLRFHGPLRAAFVCFAAAFLGLGGWIYYNTEMINSVVTDHDHETSQVAFEKQYKKYEKLPMPRVTDVKYNIDLYPERSGMSLRGEETIRNQTSGTIDQIHFTLADWADYDSSIQLDNATLTLDDKARQYRIYRLSQPMQPGETRLLRFTVTTNRRGFQNQVTNVRVVSNGTFFDTTVVPQIGYQPAGELNDKNKRKKYGLPQREPMPALERNCSADCMSSYISNNSDWVNVDTVISTAPDQTAIAPGSLIKNWTANNRCYSEYKFDHAGLNFYSFLSAHYQVARREWNGVSIEVYYLKEHPWNVPKMLEAVEKSFEYYTTHFGPYPNKEARIIEFPRVASFAQAFEGTMPYSESIGFIANLEHPDDIDKVYYVVAHEMGHQWWAHQVVGANMQGATSLSETLAQYSALMVMEKRYGRDSMRKFMSYEMDGYLRARGREMLKEQPLLRVYADQGYIHYNKGAVVMYYLKEMLGEDAVNTALRKVLRQYGYAPPPYPVSYALADALSEQAPPQLRYLIQDLFYDITLFSNRALSASAKKQPDGKYLVTVNVETHKFKADDQGNEKEVPVDDWIEVGALAAPAKGKKYGDVLHRERVHMKTGTCNYTFTTDRAPDKAGIDPLALLVDRVPDDNLKSVTIQ